MARMDENEIDTWYSDERDSAFQEYLDGVESGKDKEKLKKAYLARMKKARIRYQKLYDKSRKPGIFNRIWGWMIIRYKEVLGRILG